MSPDGIEIEVVRDIAQAHEIERLQLEIWNGNEGWIVPSHVLLIVSSYGGIVLGARVDGVLVGFVLGFLARGDETYFHASHMLGVHPSCQQQGIGAALKWRQREVARGQGLDLMRWTFDPLESRNAYFNFHKLGTVSHLYRPDYYGPMQDGLNRDLPSDRLLVDWHFDGECRPEVPDDLHRILRDLDGTPDLHIDNLGAGRPIAIEIPHDLQSIKREDPEQALAWRIAVRRAFSVAFEHGYQACDFRDGAYVLMPGRETSHEN